jgi:NTP pyrophosphatase (non-canonical NTP hydrolase)
MTEDTIHHSSIQQSFIFAEYRRATDNYGKFSSAHEGYAVLLEEVDELWDEVKKNPKSRDPHKMAAEARQVAAMALRFLVDCCPNPAGI